jgi:hypothetical protein
LREAGSDQGRPLARIPGKEAAPRSELSFRAILISRKSFARERMMMRICAAVLMMLALAPARAGAQEEDANLPNLVQELFQGETVYPQEAGGVQLTADGRFADAGTARMLVEYGITDRLLVSVATPYLQLEQGGEETMTAGAFFNLLNGPDMAASVSLEAVIPTGGRDMAVAWEPALIVARQVGMAQLHGSLAASLSSDGSELSPGLGLMLDADRLTPTLELTATMADGEPTDVALTPGIFLHLGPRLEIGLAAPLRLHGATQPDVLAVVTLEL